MLRCDKQTDSWDLKKTKPYFKITRKQKAESVRTIVFVRAMGVAVDGAGLAVCGPAGVSQAEVCVELLFQVQRILLCVRNIFFSFYQNSDRDMKQRQPNKRDCFPT